MDMPRGRTRSKEEGGLTIQKGDELFAGALGAESKGDGRKAVDSIEAEEDIIMLGEDASEEE